MSWATVKLVKYIMYALRQLLVLLLIRIKKMVT